MNKEKKHKNKKFPGFYIALCCCVLAIGAAGYLSERHESERASSNAKNIEGHNSLPGFNAYNAGNFYPYNC